MVISEESYNRPKASIQISQSISSQTVEKPKQARQMAGRTRPSLSAAVVYEDFQPLLERKEEQGANVLSIHLPGFSKEQISVTYVDSTRTIKVQGERPLDRNRRSRLNQGFPVPQNSIIERIQGSFRNGILTITIPKQTITQVAPVKDADTTKEAVPPETSGQQKPVKDQKEPTPSKAASTSTSGFAKQRDQKLPSPQTSPKAVTQKGPQNGSPKSAPRPTTLGEREKPANGKKVDALQPSKQQEETQKKVAPAATTAQQTEEKTESVEKKVESKVVLESLVKEKENREEKKDTPVSESNIPKIWEKEKKEGKATGVVEDKKAKEGGSFMAKAKEMKGMDTIMKTVKRLATDDYEDRQLLINIGVSVLVVVALGAYITYTYRSTGRAKH